MAERVLDPQVAALLAQIAELGQPPFEHMTVAQAREAGARAGGGVGGTPLPDRTHGGPARADLHP